MSNKEFELDFETVSEKRKSVKETITASRQVRGDMVQADRDFINIKPTKEVEGAWEFDIVKED